MGAWAHKGLHLLSGYESLSPLQITCETMRGPGLGEVSLGAAAGAATGAIGGLFGIGFLPSIQFGDPSLLIATPTLNLVCFGICGGLGWLLGGQLGPRLETRFSSARAEIAGGIVGGLLPVVLVALWGWRMAN